jgi:hypothetical protein
VTLSLQAGEELRGIATDVRWFLRDQQGHGQKIN